MDSNPVVAAIQQMNEGPEQTPSPAPVAPAAVAPSAPAAPPAQKTATPPQSPTTPPATPQAPGADDTLLEPSFLRKNGTGEPAPTEPAAQATPAAEEEGKVAEAAYSHLSKLTDGRIKSEADWVNHTREYNELVAEAEKGFEPKFANERAKWAHKLLSSVGEGAELDTAMRTLRALQFKADGKSDRDILFERYIMDPANADIPAGKIQEYFDAEYETKYELLNKKEDLTPEESRRRLVLERELAKSVTDAKAGIKKIQDEFSATDAGPKQISKEVETSVQKATQGFGGIRLSFSENAPETEMLTIPVKDPQILESIRQAVLDPAAAHEELVAQFVTKSGGVDYPRLVQEQYERTFHREIRQQAFEHGKALGKLEHINKERNASSPKDIAKVAAPAATGKTLNFQETWKAAAQAKGR